MKTIKTISLFLFITIIISSCTEKFFISKRYIDRETQKPVPGLQIGLYKAKKFCSWDATFDTLKLVSISTTDTSGVVAFEHPGVDVNINFYIPIYSADSTSVNAKYQYNLSSGKYDDASPGRGGVNEPIEVTRNYNVILRLLDFKYGPELIVKRGEDRLGMVRQDDIPYFWLNLPRGEASTLQFYKIVDNKEVFVAEKTIYVKFIEPEKKYVFQLPIITFDIKLGI
jgi:hypothetical protein